MASKLPQVTIIGAGLSGLALGLSLQSKGIASILYDRATSASRYNYGITLYPSTYRPLLSLLDMDESSFRRTLAVNAHEGGLGSLSTSDGFRCHRGRLEALLGRSLSIQWDKKLKEINMVPASRDLNVVFEDGHQHKTTCLVGCDGPHSITRQSLAAGIEPEVLPYVVFNGRRRMSPEEYAARIREYMKHGVQLQTRVGNVFLEISVNDMSESRVELSYVYSRPARDNGRDALHHPGRATSGATDTPEAFYDELKSLHQSLALPFRDVFDADRVKKDRTLHWLMRCLTPEPKVAQQLSERGVLLIGDAVHATPILGGEGAQLAIQDGLDLAEYISNHGVDNLGQFASSKYDVWRRSVEDSKKRIAELHVVDPSRV
ncbi:hypothetical protein PFICI_09858 [Pestalotiopsis fici W106-1]|uniref:FAD-binding domain-containing protein n=1 Tax=Pestalotiopsis fici (strain W106-1 / CGMCC3.15140) TaxID=1229662 RepID=W3WY35_PESFW|nr:uncharacterized protein PFICI_09858 [Pestalotiopsis fici W106-1]ETS77796.1 hypothetical protein PFICI_09858 [Pestalotiopsis fici W106-1]